MTMGMYAAKEFDVMDPAFADRIGSAVYISGQIGGGLKVFNSLIRMIRRVIVNDRNISDHNSRNISMTESEKVIFERQLI